ncbi:hypothetical protein BSK59_13465 [Paenibacillus odorifer]|uniref:hypothetical protein n=1 Tax=Paenibacillus odorifer TaxID=189426 RepID=UPI00096D00CC|nr:hypothetical protein [Paenibacillus odorifer]OME55480.1 hypothetical protein BSK59_13465 [Paenibacillus odorifer]
MNNETKIRTLTQKQKIISMLRAAGINGVTNVDLSEVALRYNARIQELYVEGYRIGVNDLAGGLTKYILIKEPETKRSKPEKALDILIDNIKENYNNNISTEQLIEELQASNFTVRRRNRSFC